MQLNQVALDKTRTVGRNCFYCFVFVERCFLLVEFPFGLLTQRTNNAKPGLARDQFKFVACFNRSLQWIASTLHSKVRNEVFSLAICLIVQRKLIPPAYFGAFHLKLRSQQRKYLCIASDDEISSRCESKMLHTLSALLAWSFRTECGRWTRDARLLNAKKSPRVFVYLFARRVRGDSLNQREKTSSA